jgi:hypothetical protein
MPDPTLWQRARPSECVIHLAREAAAEPKESVR